MNIPFKPLAEVEELAASVLARHNIVSIPVDPVSIANLEGIKVHNAKFSEEGLSGLIAKRGNEKTLLVNESDPPFRKRFTIAHELGHLYLHLGMDDGEFVDSHVDFFRDSADTATATASKRAEIQANQFAAALLMPADSVQKAYSVTSDLRQLARLFNVSEAAMGFRLSKLGLI